MTSFFSKMRHFDVRPSAGQPNLILVGSVTRMLLKLSLPMIAAMFLVTANGLVDMVYLGRVSKQAMAAVGVAFPVTFLLHTMAGALGTASTSLCSRLVGTGDNRQVRNLLLHILLVVVGLTLVITPLSLLLLRPVITATADEAAVIEGAITYGRIICLGALLGLLPMSINALFRGEGDSIFPFRVMIAALSTNILLDPVFIFGLGPAPRLGVAGAAVATLCGYTLAALLILRELFNRDRIVRLDRRAWHFDPGLLRDLGSVAGPAAIGNLSMPVSVWITNWMIRPFGTEALAALSAGTRLLAVIFLPSLGISTGMLVMVGQNHGAQLRDRVKKITLTSVAFSLAMLGVLALPLALWPTHALSLFTSDQAVLDVGRPLVRWLAIARPFLSIVMITAFWFQARGQGFAGMAPNTIMRIVFEPLGLWLGIHFGGTLLAGWQSMALADLCGGLLCLLWLLWRLHVYVRGATDPRVSPQQ